MDDPEGQSVQRPKKIIVSPPAWRSQRFVDILQCLDRKWLRKCSERSRAMMKQRHIGIPSTVPAPEGTPTWMRQ